MNLFAKLLCGAALISTAASAQSFSKFGPAGMIVEDTDNYSVTLKKVKEANPYLGRNWRVDEVITNDASKVEYVQGSLECLQFYCWASFDIKKDGPVDLFKQGYAGGIAYGFADTVTATHASINTTLWPTFHIAELFTEAVSSPSQTGSYTKSGRAESVKVFETYDFIRVRTLIGLTHMDTYTTLEYQNLQFLISGQEILKVYDVDLLGLEYTQHDGNKGNTWMYFLKPNEWEGTYHWYVNNWSTGTGHYGAFRFFLNGTEESDPGLDISEFNNISYGVTCEAGATFEAFVGSAMDSQQQWLGDIQCTGAYQEFDVNISGMNRTDIQTGIWFHLPTWKNTNMAQEQHIWLEVDHVIFYK